MSGGYAVADCGLSHVVIRPSSKRTAQAAAVETHKTHSIKKCDVS